MQDHTNPTHADRAAMDIVTVGERGQIVIPAAIRERLGLDAGDKLMIFTKHAEIICLVPTSSMRRLVNVLTKQLEDIEASPNKQSKPKDNA